jgi:hypothetical protein
LTSPGDLCRACFEWWLRDSWVNKMIFSMDTDSQGIDYETIRFPSDGLTLLDLRQLKASNGEQCVGERVDRMQLLEKRFALLGYERLQRTNTLVKKCGDEKCKMTAEEIEQDRDELIGMYEFFGLTPDREKARDEIRFLEGEGAEQAKKRGKEKGR